MVTGLSVDGGNDDDDDDDGDDRDLKKRRAIHQDYADLSKLTLSFPANLHFHSHIITAVYCSKTSL